MDASLNQPRRVQEDGPMGCKLLLFGEKPLLRKGLTVPDE